VVRKLGQGHNAYALGDCRQYLQIRTGAYQKDADSQVATYLTGVLDGAAITKIWATKQPFTYLHEDSELVAYAVNTCLDNQNMGMLELGAKLLSIKIKNNEIKK
jgi:hypothetical protein